MKFSALLILCLFYATMYSQVVINEISTAQTSGYSDEDGDFPDWVELYNKGTNTVNLQNYKFQRIEGSEAEWVFPEIYIKPGEHLTVFASKKDRKLVFDHWEVPIFPELVWKYFVGNSEPPTNWKLPSFNDTSWSSGQGGIGYGDNDDSTIISPTTSCYLRSSFNIADTSKIAVALLAIDYDDGFVTYLNGVELFRNNVGVNGIPPAHNDLAFVEHEAKEYQGGNLEFYYIDNKILNQAKVNGLNTFSVQVHNVSPTSSDMTIRPYFLIGIKDTSVTYFSIPVQNNLHTNFNMDSSPSRLRLVNDNNITIDEVVIQDIYVNNSRGRSPDGSSQWCLFATPTPDTLNTASTCFNEYANNPSISLTSGFYNGTQSVAINSSQSGSIYYTLDGNDPDMNSTLYSGTIAVNSNVVLKAKFYPSNSVMLPSKVVTATYFIDENIKLPVVSISTAPENLFDHYTGIYAFGPNQQDTINDYPFVDANFWQGWEKPAHVEYFDRNKKLGFALDIGLKIHGNFSKSFPQKSFRILAKDDYNERWIDYNLFPNKPHLNRIKSFNLRNGGIDYNTTHFRDAFMQRVVKELNLDDMAYEPCVLFLNGEYWGVYGMRERQDDNYLYENHSELEKGTIDYLRFNGTIIEGSNQGFLSMVNYIANSDLSQDSVYDKISNDSIDIKNFTDYYITELYYGNIDWLSDSTTNNIKFWRTNDPLGKWRYVLWDLDLGTGLFGTFSNAAYDYMGSLIFSPAPINPHVIVFKQLLTNEKYKNYFINRYADLMNTTFLPNRVNSIADEMADDLEPEMTRHFNKWAGTFNIFGLPVARATDVVTWKSEIDSMLYFMGQRPTYVRSHIETDFSLNKQVNLTLEVEPKGAGEIKINTITPGESPWSGIYFDGVPVTLTAVPNSGYIFKNWESNYTNIDNNLSRSFTSNVTSDDKFIAHFSTLDYQVNIFPNPANNTVQFTYQIPNEQQLSISILTIDGKKVAELVSPDSFHQEGSFTKRFSKQELGLAAGTYFLEFKSKDFTSTNKFTLF